MPSRYSAVDGNAKLAVVKFDKEGIVSRQRQADRIPTTIDEEDGLFYMKLLLSLLLALREFMDVAKSTQERAAPRD